MKPVKLERELMRGAGPTAVLLLLGRKEMYGYELVEALSRRTDGVLAMGQSTLYPMLYNLEAKGLIRARWDEPASGRKRKYYSLTAKGEKQLDHDAAQWTRLVAALRGLGVVDATLPGQDGPSAS